jgi:hypothetical protein
MEKKISQHTRVLKPLTWMSLSAVAYLIHGAGIEASEFWNPAISLFWIGDSVTMPDVEFAEQLFKFLLNII